jgi:hypothetical protein
MRKFNIKPDQRFKSVAGSDRPGFFHTAKHMIKDAWKDFRRDLRDSFFVEMFGYESAEKIFAETTHEAQVAPRSATAKIIERQPQKL